MELVVLLFAVSLLCLQGTSTGTPEFVQTGNDLFLHVQEAVNLTQDSDFTWSINGSANIVKYDFSKKKIYDDRAEFFEKNVSLLLRNVRKKDSGVYTAKVSGQHVHTVAEYKVTVQDPVSPVKLTVNSSSTCNLTVTCSAVDSHISSTFKCDNQICSREGGESSEATTTTPPSSIDVYLKQGFIICNHSNHVSWTQYKKEIKTVCEPHPVANGAVPIAIGTGIGIIVTALCLFLFIKYKQKNHGKKVLNVPQNTNPAQTLNQNPAEEAASLSPTSTYCMIEFHTRPVESTKTKKNPIPETVYAQVKRPAKTDCRSPPQPTARAGKHQ